VESEWASRVQRHGALLDRSKDAAGEHMPALTWINFQALLKNEWVTGHEG